MTACAPALHPPSLPFDAPLSQLRHRPGSILQLCLRVSRHPPLRHACERHPGLWQLVLRIAHLTDSEGRALALRGQELAYHNRRHAADCVLAMAWLLAGSTGIGERLTLLSIAAMAGHDLGHQGRSNHALGACQEARTARRLDTACAQGLARADRALLARLVRGTDPAQVDANHDRYLADPADARGHVQVLMNEADIAASLSPRWGPPLTRALQLERGEDASGPRVQRLWQAFVMQSRISTPAGRRLLRPHPLEGQDPLTA